MRWKFLNINTDCESEINEFQSILIAFCLRIFIESMRLEATNNQIVSRILSVNLVI